MMKMMKRAVLLLAGIAALLGGSVLASCCQPPPPALPALSSPENGSTISSLTPIVTWATNTSGALYRIQIANDVGFQNLVVDQANLAGLSYEVPAGKLSGGQTYYWKVMASIDSRTSGWTPYWSFQTPSAEPTSSTIRVNATLDGEPWTGSVSYSLSGPDEHSGSSVPVSYTNLPVGTYTVKYNSGGPAGATLASIVPQPTQTTIAGSTTTFTLNFYSAATSAIRVQAARDGLPWTGKVYYKISGAAELSGSSVSNDFSNLPIGTYTVSYNTGGPAGATLISIMPQPTQTTVANLTTTFTLNFASQVTSTVKAVATLDDKPWNGPLHYEVSGPFSDHRFVVPEGSSILPSGTYALGYIAGGPPGATFAGISPSAIQSVVPGGMITFTMRFYSVASGKIMVNATVNGQPWAGNLNYNIIGPYQDAGYSVPQTFNNVPAGTYTLVYRSDVPNDRCDLDTISPSPTQELSSNGTLIFTFKFICKEPRPEEPSVQPPVQPK